MKQFLFLALLFIGCENPAETADCAGVVGGIAEKDTCGVCNGDGTSCIDCADVPNGDSVLDDCGVCDANLSNNCQDCSTHFSVNQSVSQAFYYFYNVTINSVPVAADDSVAAFKDDICVGVKKWDVSLCSSNVCELGVMGYDGTELTAGYMLNGDIPTFKIYDVSEGLIYNAITTSNFQPWDNLGIFANSTLEAVITSAAPCQ